MFRAMLAKTSRVLSEGERGLVQLTPEERERGRKVYAFAHTLELAVKKEER
jgi:hypothetical protein